MKEKVSNESILSLVKQISKLDQLRSAVAEDVGIEWTQQASSSTFVNFSNGSLPRDIILEYNIY
uniref:Uncharacterized protein n=1 Tax=Rhizophagus irregularis (strain DAOM 181602 / DAOM 197198 / MUCL 43194) TaxID=747089 RepID=U9T784_RHIID